MMHCNKDKLILHASLFWMKPHAIGADELMHTLISFLEARINQHLFSIVG